MLYFQYARLCLALMVHSIKFLSSAKDIKRTAAAECLLLTAKLIEGKLQSELHF